VISCLLCVCLCGESWLSCVFVVMLCVYVVVSWLSCVCLCGDVMVVMSVYVVMSWL